MNSSPIHCGHCESYNSLLAHVSPVESKFKPPIVHVAKSAQIEFDFNFNNQSIHKIYAESLKVDICNFERISQPISGNFTKMEGDYILIMSWWMNHYGHCMLDILPAFEYIRHLHKDTSFKFLVPRRSPIGSILLALDSDFWRNKIEYYSTNLKLKGDVKIYSIDAYPHRLVGGAVDLIKRIRRQTPKDSKVNDLIFCPRFDNPSSANGKRQTIEQIDLILKTIQDYIKNTGLDLNFKVFNPLLDDGSYMSMPDQKLFFENAHTIVGPRGSALLNCIWSKRFTDKNSPPLNIIEFTQCEGEISKIISTNDNDHRLRTNDDLGLWVQLSGDFNYQLGHLFYYIENSNDSYIHINTDHLIQLLNNINQTTHYAQTS